MKPKVVKAWAVVDDKGKITFPSGSRMHKSKNGKYQWYKYAVISDKRYGAVRQNGGHKAVRVQIKEIKK